MSLIRIVDASIEFGDNPLLKNANLSIEEEERVCLVGRNGAGKTTLMNIIAGNIQVDNGVIHRQQDLRISQLQQNLPDAINSTVYEVVKHGLNHQLSLIAQYEMLAKQEDLNANQLHKMEQLQTEIDSGGGWQVNQQTETIISQLGLPAEKKLSQLSGGWRRRVALGQALVSKPNLLLLDEPTNHLDINTIQWLESILNSYRGSVIFITHDREFLQQVATRIVEVDRGRLFSWPGNYKNFLKLKEQSLKEEEANNALFDKRLAQEEKWVRQGIKARRTRNEGRVRALEAMRKERSQRIKQQGRAKLQIEDAEKSGRKVIEARGISHRYDQQQLINKFKLKILRGDRIGLIGNNGVGKSTLLKILLGQITPDEGSVKIGTNISLAYFDQVARELDEEKSISENVGLGRDFISINGKERHIISYLQNFLFSPKRAMTPVKALSGGEKNRVSLAKLFAVPCNLLVLDEPTNDLDIEMLEVLEERLVHYNGSLIVVSHDRAFLDNVVTSILVFEEDGKIAEYIGGYSDWLKRNRSLDVIGRPELKQSSKMTESEIEKSENESKHSVRKAKLSYHLQRELDEIPELINKLENKITELETIISADGFYKQSYEKNQQTLEELSNTQKELDQAMDRWVEIENQTEAE
ncbi:MAG: ATP-binding cassette domain-containing protein [Pseudomonadota bacterium]|nr:ATP-binding cassette domain-containing protein [Pseudomonadota bacterium]